MKYFYQKKKTILQTPLIMGISEDIQNWYEHNKRELPWRKTSNPYHILVSEVILQQTKIEQGINYYYRFIEKFPDIDSLAISTQDEVFKIWQGLGYYSRARNLLQTAIFIKDNYNSIIPETFEQLIQLKGIGHYTAGAVASIAFKQPVPAVDGNVIRVLSRVFGISELKNSTNLLNQIKSKALIILDKSNPGTHNQAIMELGALLCQKEKPKCDICPISQTCYAFNFSNPGLYPIKGKVIQKKKRYFNYLFILCGNYTFMQKRKKKDIWHGLYEPILIETEYYVEWDLLQLHDDCTRLFSNIKFRLLQTIHTKHILTHQEIFINLHVIVPDGGVTLPDPTIKTKLNEINSYPISRALEKTIQKLYILNEQHKTEIV